MANGDYTPLWRDLGIDLASHDALLDHLQRTYEVVYLSQQRRPQAMGYFDDMVAESHGRRIQELVDAKRSGRAVVGSLCAYVPEEIIMAAGAINVGLYHGMDAAVESAEQVLPRDTCALIKSFVGSTLTHLCPLTAVCDLVVGETTCDGKKKAYEIFGELKETFVLELPHMKSPAGRALWRGEIVRLIARLEPLSGRKTSAERLRQAVRTINAKRRALARLNRLRSANPAPISGRDALLVNQVQFYDEPVRFTEKVSVLCDELEGRVAGHVGVAAPDTPRLLVSGCPMAPANWKVPYLIESNGAVIVAEESCVGERGSRNLVSEEGQSRQEILDRIAERYLTIDCAVFTPNEDRQDDITEMIRKYDVQGVIHYAISHCTPYLMETHKVARTVRQHGLPLLCLETDYGMRDSAPLETRVQAFLELLK